jgi:hypothetical protein
VFGSGCYGLRYRFGNPRLILIPNAFKHPSLRTNAVSEAISKRISTIQYEIASGFAHRNDVDCFALFKKGIAMMISNEGEAVLRLASLAAPSASLTQSTPIPLTLPHLFK